MNRLLNYFKSRSLASIGYAAASVLAAAVVVLIFARSLFFSVRTMDALLLRKGAGEEEILSLSSFDMADFAVVGKKLGIAPATNPPPTAPMPAPAPSSTTENPSNPSAISLEVLNATGIPGLAREWQNRFQNEGFRNILIGNAPSRTGILIRHKEQAAIYLNLIRKILLIGKRGKGLLTEEDNAMNHDITILMGKEE